MVKTLFKRAERICSTNEDRLEEQIIYLTTTLKNNGYPISIIKRISRSCPNLQKDAQKEIPKATVFHPHIQNVSEAIKRNLNIRTATQNLEGNISTSKGLCERQ